MGDFRRRRRDDADLIGAEEMACFAYCPEQWRLQYNLGLPSANRAALSAGTRHHDRKATVERVAGGSIGLGKFFVVAATVVLMIVLWLGWP
jgi:hypothetical protein